VGFERTPEDRVLIAGSQPDGGVEGPADFIGRGPFAEFFQKRPALDLGGSQRQCDGEGHHLGRFDSDRVPVGRMGRGGRLLPHLIEIAMEQQADRCHAHRTAVAQ